MRKIDLGGFLMCLASMLGVTACGGGGDATISGTVTGLGPGLSVTVQNSNADTLTLTANGTFTFPSPLGTGDSFNVTVQTQPVGQNCSVVDGSGTVDTSEDSVNSVVVSCTTSSSVGATVSGLGPGTSVTLSDGSATLAIATNGLFAFDGTLAAGAGFVVTITTQPVGQTCTIADPNGIVVANVTTLVAVTCH